MLHNPDSSPRLSGAPHRRPVNLSQQDLVAVKPLLPASELPVLVEPRDGGLHLGEWAGANRPLLDQLLLRHGGILFRGFDCAGAQDLEDFIRAASGAALEYRERSSPRSSVGGNIYTSTDYPPRYPIFLHNENSYQSVWPRKIFFFCQTPAVAGGATPIADCRRVRDRIPRPLRDRFVEKKWMYVRNFGDGFGLDWQTVFQTSDRSAVEEHCRKGGIETEWKEGGRLRTRAVREAMTSHPSTGEMLWFNHAAFFHVSTLEPAVREALESEFSPEDLPANTYYGDGTAIAPDDVEVLRQAYRDETVSF
ncbi:MAG TPA: TauD/TfdA family dioxygenase, partial [Thermoanaerobaculia bacterium]|nr:TauD/TfdA family dioxygenase [Thermoanaerobaculia bacterium]